MKIGNEGRGKERTVKKSRGQIEIILQKGRQGGKKRGKEGERKELKRKGRKVEEIGMKRKGRKRKRREEREGGEKEKER